MEAWLGHFGVGEPGAARKRGLTYSKSGRKFPRGLELEISSCRGSDSSSGKCIYLPRDCKQRGTHWELLKCGLEKKIHSQYSWGLA